MTPYGAAFDWARRHVDAGRLPTAVLGIATADGVVALDAFGATDGRPARVDDPYWLFSITKVLTGSRPRAPSSGASSPPRRRCRTRSPSSGRLATMSCACGIW